MFFDSNLLILYSWTRFAWSTPIPYMYNIKKLYDPEQVYIKEQMRLLR